jgi:hypothetical protein
MRNIKLVLISVLIGVPFVAFNAANGNAQSLKTRATNANPTVAQPLFSEYKGIRLGMTATEVRAKLGEPTIKGDDQDYYAISNSEAAQFAYDSTHKVKTISIDYQGGRGAPDYRNVVGPDIETRDDGSLYKLVRYETQRFWVSYHRTGGAAAITVTITIQKF